MSMRAPVKQQTLKILRDRGVPVGTVLDVGVFHGTPELMRAYPGVKHVLFEPVTEFKGQIEKFYANLDHELHFVAVGEETANTALRTLNKISDDSISHSTVVDAPVGRVPEAGIRFVSKVALDDFLEGRDYPEPFLLKIDIDGHELQALAGARRTLPRCSVVIVECAGGSLPQRIDVVQKAGFKLFDLCEPCYYDGAFWQCDAVFVRKDIHARLFKTIDGKVDTSLYESFRGA